MPCLTGDDQPVGAVVGVHPARVHVCIDPLIQLPPRRASCLNRRGGGACRRVRPHQHSPHLDARHQPPAAAAGLSTAAADAGGAGGRQALERQHVWLVWGRREGPALPAGGCAKAARAGAPAAPAVRAGEHVCWLCADGQAHL